MVVGLSVKQQPFVARELGIVRTNGSLRREAAKRGQSLMRLTRVQEHVVPRTWFIRGALRSFG
jgi:hypothetical protein